MWHGDTAPQSIILIAKVIIINFLHFSYEGNEARLTYPVQHIPCCITVAIVYHR